MGCDTKINSLDYLRNEKIIDDTRIILDQSEFDKGNDFLTDIAVTKYGLETGGKKLFDVETTSHKILNRTQSYAASRRQDVTRAVPVEDLFVKLDELYVIKTKEQEDQIEDVLNRTPENRIINIGFRHHDLDVNHYTETKSETSNVNKQVRISNKGFLNQKKDVNLYENLVKEYKLKTGYEYNVNKLSFSALDNQKKFYDFVKKKGIKGVEVYNSAGDLQMISFKQPTLVEVEVDNGEMLKLKETVTTQTSTEPVKTALETKEKYNTEEAHEILETYNIEQVNQMLEENREGAIEIFNKLLYGEQLKTDTFVSDQDVNEQINKCK
jgi:hypothetical protein